MFGKQKSKRAYNPELSDSLKSGCRSKIPKLIQEVMVTYFSNADVRIA